MDNSERQLMDTKIVSGATTERFDLTEAAQLWLNNGNNYGIILQIENGDATHIRLVYDKTMNTVSESKNKRKTKYSSPP